MRLRLPLLLSLLTIPALAAAAASIEKIPAESKVALISAIDPRMRGQTVGITVFGNKGWDSDLPDFDVNARLLAAIKPILNRVVRLVNGREVSLLLKVVDRKESDLERDELAGSLVALGHEWGVERILLIQTCRTNDWLAGTNQQVEGFGHYSRHRNAAYGVFWLRVFDCHAGKFTGGAQVKQARMLPGVEWHDSWKEYPAEEQRVIVRGLEAMIKDAAPALLSEAGLTDAKVGERSLGSWLMHPSGPTPQSYLPEGNELEIPAGVSGAAARNAVVDGVKNRGWVMQTNDEDRKVAVYRSGKKEALCTFTFTEHSVILTPTGNRIEPDGRRVPVENYRRWHNNLKEDIVKALLKAPVEPTASP